MTDINTLIVSTRNSLHEIATQALNLGLGLQNAAPAQSAKPGSSTQYLLEISKQLEQASQEISHLANK